MEASGGTFGMVGLGNKSEIPGHRMEVGQLMQSAQTEVAPPQLEFFSSQMS